MYMGQGMYPFDMAPANCHTNFLLEGVSLASILRG